MSRFLLLRNGRSKFIFVSLVLIGLSLLAMLAPVPSMAVKPLTLDRANMVQSSAMVSCIQSAPCMSDALMRALLRSASMLTYCPRIRWHGRLPSTGILESLRWIVLWAHLQLTTYTSLREDSCVKYDWIIH